QRKAIPAKGTRFNAIKTLVAPVCSQAPVSRGSRGTECRISRNTAKSRTENTTPAMAAAFGVRKWACITPALSAESRIAELPLKKMPLGHHDCPERGTCEAPKRGQQSR